MALPKKQMSRARRHKRRSQLKIKTGLLQTCSQCRKKIKPHHICPYCGYYKGRVVFDLAAKKAKKEKKKKEKK